jgi:calicheamicin 3'-O-methyl-rhamnosyltransferase
MRTRSNPLDAQAKLPDQASCLRILVPHDRERDLAADVFSQLYLDTFPRTLQTADRLRTTRVQCLQPCAMQRDGAAPLPDALAASLDEFNDWPLAYLTFGTVVNHSPALLMATRALAELPVRLVVTVGSDADPRALGHFPPNVHVDRFVPQSELLSHCDLVVSHGGSGTLLATLAHGVPQLVLPQGADQFTNASALEASGAGLALRGDDITVASIQDCAHRLLRSADHRQQAARIAEEILAMPTADEVAAELERL